MFGRHYKKLLVGKYCLVFPCWFFTLTPQALTTEVRYANVNDLNQAAGDSPTPL